jgi:hypothetical protein
MARRSGEKHEIPLDGAAPAIRELWAALAGA